jgi:hypothetical protein
MRGRASRTRARSFGPTGGVMAHDASRRPVPPARRDLAPRGAPTGGAICRRGLPRSACALNGANGPFAVSPRWIGRSSGVRSANGRSDPGRPAVAPQRPSSANGRSDRVCPEGAMRTATGGAIRPARVGCGRQREESCCRLRARGQRRSLPRSALNTRSDVPRNGRSHGAGRCALVLVRRPRTQSLGTAARSCSRSPTRVRRVGRPSNGRSDRARPFLQRSSALHGARLGAFLFT